MVAEAIDWKARALGALAEERERAAREAEARKAEEDAWVAAGRAENLAELRQAVSGLTGAAPAQLEEVGFRDQDRYEAYVLLDGVVFTLYSRANRNHGTLVKVAAPCGVCAERIATTSHYLQSPAHLGSALEWREQLTPVCWTCQQDQERREDEQRHAEWLARQKAAEAERAAAEAAEAGFETVEPRESVPTLSERVLGLLYEVVDTRIRERENG